MARPTTLSEDDVKRLSGQYDLSSVRRLNLRDMGIGDIEVLRRCTELVALDLRGNSVSPAVPAAHPTAIGPLARTMEHDACPTDRASLAAFRRTVCVRFPARALSASFPRSSEAFRRSRRARAS